MDIQCYVGCFGPTIQAPALPWLLNNTSVEEYFSLYSANSISLTINPERITRDIVGGNATPSATPYRLNKALNALIGTGYDAPPGFSANTVGLIFADKCETIPGIYGLMFNAPMYVRETPFEQTFRQGAAVFIETIREHRTDGEFLGQVIFDVIHELGHIFNLWHTPDTPDNSTSFMTTSKDDHLHPPPYHFSDPQKVFMSEWSHGKTAPYVTPGLTAFGNRGAFSVPHDDQPEDSPAQRDLQLTIRMTQEEFWSFEPVELDLRLDVLRDTLQVEIPNEIDPSYERLRIVITEPAGKIRYYNPTELCCGNTRQIVITKAKPFVRDITLFGQAGGYTFPEPGRYQIQALFLVQSTMIRSNVVEICVLEPATRDTFYSAASRVFRNHTIAEAMYYRQAPLDSRFLLPALEIGKRYTSTAAVAGFHYALGRSLLNRAVDRTTHTNSAKDRQAGLEYLSRALDSNKLLGHRAALAEQLIQQH